MAGKYNLTQYKPVLNRYTYPTTLNTLIDKLSEIDVEVYNAYNLAYTETDYTGVGSISDDFATLKQVVGFLYNNVYGAITDGAGGLEHINLNARILQGPGTGSILYGQISSLGLGDPTGYDTWLVGFDETNDRLTWIDPATLPTGLTIEAMVAESPPVSISNAIIKFSSTDTTTAQSSNIIIDDDDNLYGQGVKVSNINASHIITGNDKGKVLVVTTVSPIDVELIHSVDVKIGFSFVLTNKTSTSITITVTSDSPTSDVILYKESSSPADTVCKLDGSYSAATIILIDTNTWIVLGDVL